MNKTYMFPSLKRLCWSEILKKGTSDYLFLIKQTHINMRPDSTHWKGKLRLVHFFTKETHTMRIL